MDVFEGILLPCGLQTGSPPIRALNKQDTGVIGQVKVVRVSVDLVYILGA